MPRRSGVGLTAVANHDTLARALWRAAKGKRHRPEVARFLANTERELAALQRDILAGDVEVGIMRSFTIRDPKPRTIHALQFRERVLHHALMEVVGPVLERALVADTFACRLGKGSLAAVVRAQQHIRRFPWYVQIDIRAYFASVDHARLQRALRRRFKNAGLLALCDRIISAFAVTPGRGLPIGALTSQHFANFYLDPLDRRRERVAADAAAATRDRGRMSAGRGTRDAVWSEAATTG